MLDNIESLKKEIQQYSISNDEELEAFRLEFLSRNGKIQEMFSGMSEVPNDQKAQVGRAMNEVKNLAEETFEQAKKKLAREEAGDLKATDDITLPAPPYPAGSFHPLTQTLEEMKNIFYRLGFSIADGPEIEDDFHNFTALNFPPNHPARDEQDTFFIEKNEEKDDLVLRTHTSPVQIRLMQQKQPPIRAIMPGRVYRNEAVSPKSYFLFHQVEALYIDTDVSIAELKETLISFAKLMFGSDVKYRLRPGFFPFTEPSLEMDIWWESANGGDGKWLEILGSGMVDPNVLKAVNIDPEEYTGFAWGMGVERIALLRHEIDDIRIFYQNDVRFLKQFH